MIPGPSKDLWNSEGNRLLPALEESLSDRGHRVVPLTWEDLEQNRYGDCDVLHVHWATTLLPLDAWIQSHSELRAGFVSQIRAYFATGRIKRHFGATLEQWKAVLGTLSRPLVWELHDLGSHHLKHRRLTGFLDRETNRLLWRHARVVLLHEMSCQTDAERYFGEPATGSYAHVPLGPLDSQPRVSKEQARTSLDLPLDRPVIAYVGTARPNRNPANLVRIFRRSFPDVCFIVAGQGVEAYVGRRPACRVYSGYTPAKTLRDIYCAADYIVSPARDYLTSGVMRSAMNYERPVICYTTGSNRDMVAGAGLFLDEQSPRSVIQKAIEILGTPQYDVLVTKARENNLRMQWGNAVIALEKAYSQALETR